MATLSGQRATFTWALNEFNKSDEPEKRLHFTKLMGKVIRDAPTNGFTVEQITQGQSYPVEVQQYVEQNLQAPNPDSDEGMISEQQASEELILAVDISNVIKLGDGKGVVYAYGYSCIPDRLKVGSTEKDTIQRIAQQIGTSTPDKPTLYLEIKTHECRALERAIQCILEFQGRKISGGGDEWFKVDRDEIIKIYHFITSGLVS